MIGDARTGKSTFLSNLIGTPGSFQTGAGVDGVTQGIWIYKGVYQFPGGLNGEPLNVIFLDTEGLDDVKNNNGKDA